MLDYLVNTYVLLSSINGFSGTHDAVMFLFHEQALKRDRIAMMQPREMKSIDTSLNDVTAEKRGESSFVSLLVLTVR